MTDNDDIRLTTLLAVELLRGETPHHVAEAVITAGSEIRKFFRRLEVLDLMTVGTRQFVRFRSDMADPVAILEHVGSKRGVVVPLFVGGFEARLGGRRGKIPGHEMYEDARPGLQRMYTGPKLKAWRTQFEEKPQISLSTPLVKSHVEGRSRPVRAEVQG